MTFFFMANPSYWSIVELTPLPAIWSETPGRVNAGAEGLDVPGHGSQPCITRTSSRSCPS